YPSVQAMLADLPSGSCLGIEIGYVPRLSVAGLAPPGPETQAYSSQAPAAEAGVVVASVVPRGGRRRSDVLTLSPAVCMRRRLHCRGMAWAKRMRGFFPARPATQRLVPKMVFLRLAVPILLGIGAGLMAGGLAVTSLDWALRIAPPFIGVGVG